MLRNNADVHISSLGYLRRLGIICATLRRARSIQPKFPEISVQNSMDRFGKVSKKRVHLLRWSSGAIHSTKISGNFGPKLNGSVRSNRKSFEKTGPPFEVVLFSRSDRSEFWLNGSRPSFPGRTGLNFG